MSKLETTYFFKCIVTLEEAFKGLNQHSKNEVTYDIYRAACVKEFEIILEQTGNLLKKCLKPYFSSTKDVDSLTFKDIFRQASKFNLISIESSERWMEYRDSRNDTAHDYGEDFAQKTLLLLPQFIEDAYAIQAVFKNQK